MKRIGMLLTVVVAAAAPCLPLPAEAQSASKSNVKPRNPTSHVVPMHPDTLTLYPHGRPKPRHAAHSFTRHRFDRPTPIHNTFMGPRYY